MLINSAFYEDLADYKILFNSDLNDIISNYTLYKRNCTIYCKSDFVNLLFLHLKLSNREYNVITHHSDFPASNFSLNRPKCVKKWFAINLENSNDNTVSIPLGTKTPFGRAYHESQYEIEWLESNLVDLKSIKKDKTKVYCNWTITNLNRMNIIENLNVDYHHSHNLSFKDYCRDMAKYQFVISPPGNGLDNHRTWEALYMGCYPIVIKNKMYDSWKDLPILQVNNYSEINQEMLESFFEKKYNLEKLNTNYWTKIIKEQ